MVNRDPWCQGNFSCPAAPLSHLNKEWEKQPDFKKSVIFTGYPCYLLEEKCEILSVLCYDFRDYLNTLRRHLTEKSVSVTKSIMYREQI